MEEGLAPVGAAHARAVPGAVAWQPRARAGGQAALQARGRGERQRADGSLRLRVRPARAATAQDAVAVGRAWAGAADAGGVPVGAVRRGAQAPPARAPGRAAVGGHAPVPLPHAALSATAR